MIETLKHTGFSLTLGLVLMILPLPIIYAALTGASGINTVWLRRITTDPVFKVYGVAK